MKALGIIIYVAPNMVGEEEDFQEFLDEASCVLEGLELPKGAAPLKCKWYDEETGNFYFHFKNPIEDTLLTPYFSEKQIIFEES